MAKIRNWLKKSQKRQDAIVCTVGKAQGPISETIFASQFKFDSALIQVVDHYVIIMWLLWNFAHGKTIVLL